MEKPFIALVTLLSFCRITQSLMISTDEYALVAFKNTITSDPYNILSTNWTSNTSICFWAGVSCSIKHHRVTALDISGFGLKGTIAPHLGNLTFLRSLDISSNNFSGPIPYELSNLHRLKEINVGVNKFIGEIPSWFGALSRLQHMYLNNNSFSGGFPLSLLNVSKLQTLDMGYNFLDGNIPEEIGNFSDLETLNLEGNQLRGSIPYGVFNMSSLRAIILRFNSFSGELPSDICSNITPKLRRINLSKNRLYGKIPRNIYKCRELEDLRLPLNQFSGNIPSGIANLTRLRFLSLWSNQLKGEILQELGILAKLEQVDLYNNSFTGSIPSSVFNISTLKSIDLSSNRFFGSLPSNMGLSVSSLDGLFCSNNGLIGVIPTFLTNASQLSVLELSNNSFTGSIPNFGNSRFLSLFNVWGNNLHGDMTTLISSFTGCKYLKHFDISLNPIQGMIPSSVGNLSSSLRNFYAKNCSISGHIPNELGNLSSLLLLDLSQNKLQGFIPTTFGKLMYLQRISLRSNQLEGYIPHELCQMSDLGEIYIYDNMLIGQIPQCFGEFQFLKIMSLGSNKLNSTIPSSFWSLRDLLYLNLSSNYLIGHLLPDIGSMKTMYLIDLSSNQLSGDIPSSIDGCQSLETINLSNNSFEGYIPESLGNVRGLNRLDLSDNNLSGLIPKSLEELNFLHYFDVSGNTLEGQIPSGGPFVNFTAKSFVHNSALCGARRFQVPPCVENKGRSRSKNVRGLLIKYILPPFISTIIIVIVIVILIRRQKQRAKPLVADISLNTACRKISYVELEQGTSSFSETNLLGRGSFGSVFKATLNDGLNVAVKVFNLQLERAVKSFDTECEIMSSIRHRNLVGIIGCCSNIEFKALILSYMPNGSLEKWLCSENCCLDLPHRLKIATDVAFSLEYLHHGHTFPIVHCDIKPSNVLLDEDMTAHVGDFGISKLFNKGEAVIQTKTLATIGYAAPEYGSEGIVSTNGDVYSYGILLLEMFTGKKPTNDMFSDEMSLKSWVSKAIQENAVSEVVAPSLLSREDQHLDEKVQLVTLIFDLAMKCLAFSPEERISMVQIVAALHKINPTPSRTNKSNFHVPFQFS